MDGSPGRVQQVLWSPSLFSLLCFPRLPGTPRALATRLSRPRVVSGKSPDQGQQS